MVKRADEDFDSKPIFQEFLLTFCEAAARSCRTGLHVLALLPDTNVSPKASMGPRAPLRLRSRLSVC